jgi:hypothetical protein
MNIEELKTQAKQVFPDSYYTLVYREEMARKLAEYYNHRIRSLSRVYDA